jgi:hypothetical protein
MESNGNLATIIGITHPRAARTSLGVYLSYLAWTVVNVPILATRRILFLFNFSYNTTH